MPEGKTHFIADLVDADTAIEEAKRVAERVAVECKLSDESLKVRSCTAISVEVVAAAHVVAANGVSSIVPQ